VNGEIFTIPVIRSEFDKAFPYLEEIYNDSSKESKGRSKIKYWEKTVSKYFMVRNWLKIAMEYWMDFKDEGKQYKVNVLKSNNYECNCCGKKQSNEKRNNSEFIRLNIHYKENPVLNKEIRYDLNNAYVLCGKCENK
jgi:hypothetical protein